MKKYFIVNLGCDDHTEFTLELTDEELKTILKFCNENNKVADYQCKPEIQVFEYDEKINSYYDCDNPINKQYRDFI
ncbi:MAG: hypothetical protein J6T23_02615 [Elusimicrobia bacterium]|nr:hypothetical protein [Elusimicrobiota bacterium]